MSDRPVNEYNGVRIPISLRNRWASVEAERWRQGVDMAMALNASRETGDPATSATPVRDLDDEWVISGPAAIRAVDAIRDIIVAHSRKQLEQSTTGSFAAGESSAFQWVAHLIWEARMYDTGDPGESDRDDETVANVAGAVRFLHWLQKTKRFGIGGHSKPNDWMNNKLSPVSTPAFELLSEFAGRDFEDIDLPDDVRRLANRLFPIDKRRRDEVDRVKALFQRGEIERSEMRRRVDEIWRDGVPEESTDSTTRPDPGCA